MRIVSVFLTVFLMFFSMGCESDSNSQGTTSSGTSSNISFTITPVTDASISTLITSEDINVTGITDTVSVTLSNGTLLKNGTALATLTTTMVDGDILAIRLTSSTNYETTVTATLTVGGVTQTFSVTTASSNQPDSFSFTSVTGAVLSTSYTSNTITVSGLDSNTTVTGSFYDGGNTAAVFVNGANPSDESSFTVNNGDEIYITLVASGSYSTTLSATLTIGATSGSYSVTSMSSPTLSVTPATLSLSYNESATLTASISPASVDGNITYTSSDTTVATVNASGVVTAVGEGTATITATADLESPHGTASDTVSVTVNMDTAIMPVEDMGGSAAYYNSPVPNSSFVDVVVDSEDDYAFVANYVGIVVVDINESRGSYMTQAGAVDINTTEHVELTFDDSRLFVAAGYDGLVSVGVSTPTSPSILARYDSDYNSTSKYAWSVALAGNNTAINKALVANCAGVDMFDVSSSSAITRLDELNITGGDCSGIATKTNKYDVALSSTYAFVAYGAQGIQIVDWTDASNLDLNGSYSSATCTDARGVDLSISRNTLFVACGTDGVDILDVSDPQNISKLANYTPAAASAKVEDVKLSSDGDYLLVTHGAGVELLDVSTPASPTFVGAYTSVGNAYATVFDSNDTYYYLSDDGNGLRKLELVYQ